MIPIWILILTAVVLLAAAVGAGIVSYRRGYDDRRKKAEAEIGSAEQEAERIVSEAKKDADSLKKEKLIETKDEIYKARQEADREIKERRSEISRQERRVQQKEETLDKKLENIERKNDAVQQKLAQADDKLAEAEKIRQGQLEMLERISQFTQDQAKDYLLKQLEDELVHEKAVRIMNYDAQIKEECEAKARQYISLAIARCAADQVSESAISVVPLPSP